MSRTGGKGRISNNLVAASCAAVLTVYAAGYWRTRDEARRMESQAQERRPARAAAQVAAAPAVAVASPPQAPVTPAPEPQPEPPSPAPQSIQARPPGATASEDTSSAKASPAAKASGSTPVVAAVPSAPSAPKGASEPPPSPARSAATSAPATVAAAAPAKTPPAVYSVPLEEPAPPAPATPPPPGPRPEDAPVWRDGTYTGWGQSYHGDIEARVVIENGRIVGSGVATCATRYPCDVIDIIYYQPIERQSPDVDRVSRATESADAYYYGLVEALKKAEVPADAAAATTPP